MESAKSVSYSNKGKGTIINLEQGKIPPQALDLEEAVLGAMMIDKKGVDDVIDIIHADAFYKPAHQFIYNAIFSLFENSEPIDLLTVSNQLKKDEKLEAVGGDFYLINLSQKVSSAAHIEFHARIILQKLKKIEEISNQEGMSGVATGFSKLDQLTSGWQPSDLVILAARPGMGKTAFVMSMAKNMAIDFDIPVAIFSLEMSSVQLITRMISSETGISSEKLRKGNLETYEWEALNVKVKKLSDAPIFIDDTPSLSVFDLRAKARRLVSQHNVRCVIIDYLQLMTAGSSTKSSGNREQEISTISRNLKALAKELSVPVIALSQLSRAVETRGGSKRPLLSDLRESGAIEQDADIVSFIYRPEYYGLTEWDDDERTPCDGQAEFIVAKHRNGGLENIRMKFIGRLAKFANLDEGFETEFQSSMNAGQISPSNFTSANDAFGNMDKDDDVPF